MSIIKTKITKNLASMLETRLAFLSEKRNKAYRQYTDVSIAREKADIVQEALQRRQLCWLAGRAGI
jgi:hypothetical protein